MSDPKKPEEDWSSTWREKLRERKFAHQSRMIIAGMGNSQTVLLTFAPEQQPSGVQVVEGVELVAGGFCIAVQFSAPILLFFSIHNNLGHLNG